MTKPVIDEKLFNIIKFDNCAKLTVIILIIKIMIGIGIISSIRV